MFTVNIDTSGLLDGLHRFPPELTKAIRATMKDQLMQVVRRARKEHRYGSQTKAAKVARMNRGYRLSGKLAMSTLSEVNETGTVGQAYLESGVAPYGVFVHEGHGASHKSVLHGFPYVWNPDRFLDESLKKQEPEIAPAFERAINQAIREAGL